MVNIYYTLSNLFTHLATHSFIQLSMPQFTNIYISMTGSGPTVTESDTSNLCIRGLTF